MELATGNFIYTYTFDEGERSLCELEMRSFFGEYTETGIMLSHVKIDPSRSPFLKERIDVMFEGKDLQEIIMQVKSLQLGDESFKVLVVKTHGEIEFRERRRIEREIGLVIPGVPELDNPEVVFGLIRLQGQWAFGLYHTSDAVWLQHQKKPHSYSTSLSTRVARAVANIAVPVPDGVKAIDPCCGIGTVLVEALSMGIDIVGSDNNPLILQGTRENIAYFGLETEVAFKDIRHVTESYDVAIIDMPYNLCSVITEEEQLEMLESARRIADKLVIVTIEKIDPRIIEAGFEIVDRGVVKKGSFEREVIVCKKAE